jgi:hypothetical protein
MTSVSHLLILFAAFGAVIAKPHQDEIPRLPSGQCQLICFRCFIVTGRTAFKKSAADFVSQKYDYVVVGGGTAGLVVAARLSEDPEITVGVIEAGAYIPSGSDPRLDIIALYGAAFGDELLDWNLKTVPQDGLGGRIVDQPVYVLRSAPLIYF